MNEARTASDYHYVEARELGVQGRPFEQTANYYTRLPARAEKEVREELWKTAQTSGGMFVDFITDSPSLALEMTLHEDNWPLVAIPTRDCSVDVYARDGQRWGFVGFLRDLKRPTTRGIVQTDLPKAKRLYRAYLPYMVRVAELKVGVEPGSALDKVSPSPLPPVVCYGTSIIAGSSASRVGMTVPAQLNRRLDRVVMNLGFGGNAWMDFELLEYFSNLKPAVFCVDALPNMDPEMITQRTVPFVTGLRWLFPAVPILVVENIVYQTTYMLADKRRGWWAKNQALKKQFQILTESGVTHLHYLTGEGLLGTDGEGTTDGTHPSDVGMTRLADAYEAALRPLL